MNTTYYYEINKKSQVSERNLSETIEEESDTSKNGQLYNDPKPVEYFLNDYEIISNDDFEEDNEEIVDLTSKNYETERKIESSSNFFNYSSGNVELNKLNINLNSTKISLKSQASKINKSISPEAAISLHNQQTRECKKAQHVPLSFTIEPLDNEHIDSVSVSSNESSNLPEIVLTSFEMREGGATTRHAMKKSATVTFQTLTTTTTASSTLCTFSNTLPTETSIQKRLPRSFAKIPTLPPPPSTLPSTGGNLSQQQSHQPYNAKSYRNSSTTTAIVEVHDGFRRDSEDSSEIYSLHGGGGNSTSPESLMDTILSAASSVSVCNSSTNSLSNAATDITRLGVNFGVDSSRMHGITAVDIRRLSGDVGANTTAITTTTTTSIEGTYAGRKEMLVNGSLNSKSNKVSPATPILTTTSSLIAPALALTATTTTATITAATPITAARISERQSWLQPPEYLETASSVRSRSPSPAPSILILPERVLYPDDLKCQICADLFNDPRTLNCLHSFCFQCLVNENFKQDKSIPFWSQPNETNPATAIANENNEWKSSAKSNCSFRSLSPDTTVRSFSEAGSSPLRQRRASFSFRRKKSQDRIQLKAKSDGRASENSSTMRFSTLPNEMEKKVEEENERVRFVLCKTCNFATELPIGGLRQLPQNFLLTRKIEEIKLKAGDEIISYIFCTLCFEETNATYHCISCTLNLCTLCKDAHERQRNTANHTIKNIMELRRARKQQQNMLDSVAKFTLKCGMHPGFEVKSLCTVCLQVACADCLVLLHKGHKHETISKAIVNYSKLLTASVEQTRPLCNYAEHTVERLSAIAKDINRKCDEIQAAIETFMQQYFEALEVHRNTLLQQVNRARESKIEILLEQQLDIEKRSTETLNAVHFYQELKENASDVEVLSFVNILLKRFEYCQQFKTPIDPKISDSLHFLPKIIAPATKEQNDITLYGIITMQIVEPTLCSLQVEGFSHLRLHKRMELTIFTRDADNVPLCHGGMLKQIQAHLKYKESSGRELPFELSDNRDGTYCIAFTPDAQGTLILTININEKPIKGSPFTFLARTVRPHSGIYHCCSFCSSGKNKGSKSVKCSCEGRMPGYNGCGHGHAGHPGRRHWSCCGNILENSECNVANKLLNA